MLVAVAQLTSSANLLANGRSAALLAEQAAAKGARILFLPEAADYLAASAKHGQEIVQPFTTSPFITTLQSTLCKLHDEGTPLDVLVGIHEPSTTSNKVKNTSIYLDSKGKLVYRYQKLHLFDVDIPSGPIFRESDSVEPGMAAPKVISTPAGNLGSSICYDLRFPELAQYNRNNGAQILVYPSAWTMKTGPHFQKLGMATAISTQCYVILPAQTGTHVDANNRTSWGHACIIDPWGDIVAACDDNGTNLALADIDLNYLQDIRNKMPLQNQRRLNVLE